MSKIYDDTAAEELTQATESLLEDDALRKETDRWPSKRT
jgi:hypothetical protein